MAIEVINPGLQTTIQAGPRTGWRHKGVPASGAADTLSLALANRLVGNDLQATGLEVTLSAASFRFTQKGTIALTGGTADITVNKQQELAHRRINVQSGDYLNINTLTKGARIYMAVAGGMRGANWLGSDSTYLPAGLGGHQGRALRREDLISIGFPQQSIAAPTQETRTPPDLRPHIGHSWMLRAVPGPDMHLVSGSVAEFYNQTYRLSRRTNRMGAALDGHILKLNSGGRLASAAVFPGTVQCPPDGMPFLLMADAQTTGGYPRIAQVIRADRHMLGQIRPGDRIQFRRCTPQEAANVLREKTVLLQKWLGNTFQLR
jgi:biotin-dependent carboxylase-like uncharacterized protein